MNSKMEQDECHNIADAEMITAISQVSSLDIMWTRYAKLKNCRKWVQIKRTETKLCWPCATWHVVIDWRWRRMPCGSRTLLQCNKQQCLGQHLGGQGGSSFCPPHASISKCNHTKKPCHASSLSHFYYSGLAGRRVTWPRLIGWGRRVFTPRSVTVSYKRKQKWECFATGNGAKLCRYVRSFRLYFLAFLVFFCLVRFIYFV